MSNRNFYTPQEARGLYDRIVPAYRAAFAGEPWYEVSKCADRQRRCAGGLSKVAINSLCTTCGERPDRPAYERNELVDRFEELADKRSTAWYTEQTPDGLALAAIAWSSEPDVVAKEKYTDVPAMRAWLAETIGTDDISWLDEVFADKTVRPSGNLRSFGDICNGFTEQLGTDVLAFRTINERMTAAARRDFGNAATIFERGRDVPDRRDFVIIRKTS